MTYAALVSDVSDLAHLSPPDPLPAPTAIAPCFDPCIDAAATLTAPMPESGPREFSPSSSSALSQVASDRPLEPPSLDGSVDGLPGLDGAIAPPELFPQETQSVSTPDTLSQRLVVPDSFSPFPVGITVGQRAVSLGVVVKGEEDGQAALRFAEWLVPYDAVINSLRLSVTPLADGQIEVRSPGIVVRLNLDDLYIDPDLGLVFSIQQINDLFGVPASFDINDYAIRFDPPWLALQGPSMAQPAAPILLDGLPLVTPPDVTLTQFDQRIDLSQRQGRDTTLQGDLSVVGSLPGASWFLRMDQPELYGANSWRLAEAQILHQRDPLDITAGSQSAFWDNGGDADLWGITVVGRNGFTPLDLQLGGTAPRQRLQTSLLGRTITGEAAPGTLVRLTEGFGNRVLGEVFVDSSGVYRFDDVPIGNGIAASNYLLLLYPSGRLTDLPEVRTVAFSTVGGQIPAGTSAWAVAAGWARDRSSDTGFLGELTDVRGGALYRAGLSEQVTLGGGVVYDNGPRALGELFFQPNDVSFQMAAALLTPDDDGDWDWDVNLRYTPTSTLRASLSSDPIDTRLNLGWRVIPALELISLVRTENPSEFGAQVNFAGRNAFTFARVTLDTDGTFRWNGIQRWQSAELTTRGDDVSTLSEVSYNFSGNPIFAAGHAAFVRYETRNLTPSTGSLTTLGWRYRSLDRAVDGNFQWEAQVGLGFGSKGNGLIASVQTAAMPGVLLRARYDGISPTSDDSAFRLELLSSINVQGRARPGDRRTSFLRTQGGLLIEPFYDANGNGEYDEGEERFTDNANLLLILNNQPIQGFRPDVSSDDIALRLSPGTYRLDLDPAGYPLDWQPDLRAMGVVINAGAYTVVPVPFVPAYTLAGVATDADGHAIAGGRVEAISDSGDRLLSITNDAGVFFLEGLQQGRYTIQINGAPATPDQIYLDPSSDRVQELNLQLTADPES
jgi:hypothetical protein